MTGRLLITKLCVSLSLFISPFQTSAQVAGNLVIAGNGPEQATIEALARAFERPTLVPMSMSCGRRNPHRCS